MKKYDFVILGGGAAGFAAMLKASELGVHTVMVNDGFLGGTCVNVGCVPTKYLLEAVKAYHSVANPYFKALRIDGVQLDAKALFKSKDELVSKLRGAKYEEVLKGLDVELIEGRGRLVSPHEVAVGDTTIFGEKILLATGAGPRILPLEGIENVEVLTSREALELEEPPESMIIIGGRALGLEFAQLFYRVGTRVTLLQRSGRILPEDEPELAELLREKLVAEGVEIHTDTTPLRVVKTEEGVRLTAETSEGVRVFEAEKLLMATGRAPNSKDFEGFVSLRSGAVLVDEYMRTSHPDIYAAGDVVGEPMLETVAAREGYIAATNALGGRLAMDYTVVPSAVFTDPQLARVGMSDAEANNLGFQCRCSTIPLEFTAKAELTGATGAVKIVAEVSGRILGVHILAPNAADIIHEAAMIIKNQMTLGDVVETLHVFPTLSEAIKLAAQSFTRDVTRMSCCVE
jgi:mercuric reductase